MCRITSVCILVYSALFIPGVIYAQGTDYVLEKSVGETMVITAPWGSWQGWISTPSQTAWYGYTRTLTFEFETPDFFDTSTGGHLAIGIRGDARTDVTGDGNIDLQGRGIILGKVTGYPSNPPCGPTIQTKTIAMEAFWGGGNCVYGPSTEGPALLNNVRYKVEIVSENVHWTLDQFINEYTLWEYDSVNQVWVQLANEWYNETYPADNPTDPALAGWFITESHSNSAWTFYLYNVQHHIGS